MIFFKKRDELYYINHILNLSKELEYTPFSEKKKLKFLRRAFLSISNRVDSNYLKNKKALVKILDKNSYMELRCIKSIIRDLENRKDYLLREEKKSKFKLIVCNDYI